MLYQTIAAVCKAAKIPINDTPNRPISWSTVVQKMGGQRNALECREKWFDQVLPKLLARQEAGVTGLSTPVAEAAPSAQVDASAPAVPTVDPTPSAIKAPRAAEWTQTDFINLLRRYDSLLFQKSSVSLHPFPLELPKFMDRTSHKAISETSISEHFMHLRPIWPNSATNTATRPSELMRRESTGSRQ